MTESDKFLINYKFLEKLYDAYKRKDITHKRWWRAKKPVEDWIDNYTKYYASKINDERYGR